MPLPLNTFLGSYGFEENPFTLTNADDEPFLQEYFVPPPYFPSVIGNAASPNSVIVFAPRGGGKTAQKVMIEREARDSKRQDLFLCITYDSFILPERFRLSDATVEWHLTNIVKILAASIIVDLADDHVQPTLDVYDKKILAQVCRNFLSDISTGEFRAVISSLRNWQGKTEDFVKTHGGQIVNLISAVGNKFGLGTIQNLTKELDLKKPAVEEYLRHLLRIVKKIGYSSTYILVDRIDETALTQNDASNSFELIRTLLTDLHVLETENLAFKFFLWDQIEPHYVKAGARADRVPNYSLRWTVDELDKMLTQRLSSFSKGNVVSLNQLLDADVKLDVHRLVISLASGSPRDVIRMSGAIIDAHIRLVDSPGRIRQFSVGMAIKEFSKRRSAEMYPSVLDELKKAGAASFTINKLASDIFRISAQAMGRKIQLWINAGAVVQSGDVPSAGSRPQNLYSLVDPKLCICINETKSTESILENFVFVCPNCASVNIYDAEQRSCRACHTDLQSENSMLSNVGNRDMTSSKIDA